MKDVQCYELFGGIALKNHAFSFHFLFAAIAGIYNLFEYISKAKLRDLIQYQTWLCESDRL